MTRRTAVFLLAVFFAIALPLLVGHSQYQRKTLIAHRGASAYAPEHTVDSYRLAMVLLVEEKDREILSPNRLQEIHKYATGIGPAKEIIDQNPPVVWFAHDAGLSVTPYTFRAASTGLFKRVRDEMEYFLAHLNVDAVFTDNPDQFPQN